MVIGRRERGVVVWKVARARGDRVAEATHLTRSDALVFIGLLAAQLGHLRFGVGELVLRLFDEVRRGLLGVGLVRKAAAKGFCQFFEFAAAFFGQAGVTGGGAQIDEDLDAG